MRNMFWHSLRQSMSPRAYTESLKMWQTQLWDPMLEASQVWLQQQRQLREAWVEEAKSSLKHTVDSIIVEPSPKTPSAKK